MSKLLAIDVGNTNIVLGVYDGPQLLCRWRLRTQEGRTADEYGVLLGDLLDSAPVQGIGGAAMSCVVPAMVATMTELCRAQLGVDPLVAGPGVRSGMPILYDSPSSLGADRLVNAVAAYERSRAATIVVDFGTATKIEYVTARGEYLGGVICPGFAIARQALLARAARLYDVETLRPARVVGHNAAEALQSGLIFGHAAMVDGLVRRIEAETGSPARVIATGGWSALLAPECSVVQEIDQLLTLDGLRIIYERNIHERRQGGGVRLRRSSSRGERR